jgi:aminoglycoside 3-N-acetyltransferase
MISAAELTHAMRDAGVRAGDVLFAHAGMQSALRVEGASRTEKMDTVLDAMRDAVGPDGVVILPTFTYSFCRGEDFDVDGSPSTVGMLTERARLRPGARRTAEPIFSVAIDGRLPAAWERRLFTPGDVDCFGEESVFAFLHAADARLLFFGVGFGFCTYLYLVEQRLRVPYRYAKPFSGDIVQNGVRTPATASYHVRDLDSGAENDFEPLGAELLRRGLAAERRIEKGPRLLCCGARDAHDVAVEKVREHPGYLLTRGHAAPVA